MITDYFTPTDNKPVIHEDFELHRRFITNKKYHAVYEEVRGSIAKGEGSRFSCVCMSPTLTMTEYRLPFIDWTPTIQQIRTQIQNKHHATIDYGLVHYYHDEQSVIHWHSDREALRSPIFSISLGNPRRFCLRHKITKEVHTFDLFDGDLLIMKVGCQDRYEHCIKSIKEFNNPRISITFRQFESPLCSFTLTKDGVGVESTGKVMATIRKGIQLRYDMEDTSRPVVIHEQIQSSASILQSNLQKAVRRKEKDVAMASVSYMIQLGYHLNLLRRLTIITLEDACMNRYYPQVVWYFIAIQHGYQLTINDASFLYSYAGWLCELDQYHEYHQYLTHKSTCTVSDVQHDVYALAIMIRIDYGGFSSEKGMMYGLLDEHRNHTLYISTDEMKMVPYEEVTPWIMDCAIDFHCFSHMPEKIAARLQKMGVEDVTAEDVKSMIWTFDSSVNTRYPPNANEHPLRGLWDKYVLPACGRYRAFIRDTILS